MKIKTVSDYRGRMRGLLGTEAKGLDFDALHINPCRSVHTFGMKYPLDLAFVSADGSIIATRKCVEPNRICGSPSGTRSVLERPCSDLAWFDVGERICTLT